MNCDIYTPTGMHWCKCHKAHKAKNCNHAQNENCRKDPNNGWPTAVAVILVVAFTFVVVGLWILGIWKLLELITT